MYKTLEQEQITEFVIKKSKFIGYGLCCSDLQQFEQKLSRIKKEHHKATHHCYGYRIRQDYLSEGYSDDNEPAKTAGLPILEVLARTDLSQAAIVVVRYFGGIKLGTGGLTRAYRASAMETIKACKQVTVSVAHIYDIKVDYSLVGKLEYYFGLQKIPIIDTSYTDKAIFRIPLLASAAKEPLDYVTELSKGSASIHQQAIEEGIFGENTYQKKV